MGIAYKKMTSHGSVSIPVDMRRSLGMEAKDPLIVESQEGAILIKPYRYRCIICGKPQEESGYLVRGKHLCKNCAGEVQVAITLQGGGE